MLYARRGRAFVTSESQTQDGFWVMTGPCLVVSLDSPDEISTRVHEALDMSRSGVPSPSPSERLDTELLKQAGVKSFRTFIRGTRAVRISASGQRMIVTPTRNGGTSRGFEFKDSEALQVDDEALLASALTEALEAAE